METNWARISELEHLDSLGVDATRRVAGELRKHVNLNGMYPSVLAKIARAVVERKISPAQLGETVTYIIACRSLPKDHELHIKCEPAYLVGSVKAVLEKNGNSWTDLHGGSK